MCGIAGFAGIKGAKRRLAMVYGMGLGVDSRGGHAAGYVGKSGGKTRLAKVIGTWDGASFRFLEGASACETLVMHARYATCGDKRNPEHAHPFTVRDTGNGRAKLYGVHNGVIWNADESAKRHGRNYTVDSRELLHLVADGRTEEVQRLRGYGVIAWMTPRTDKVHLVKLTSSADLEVCSVKGGGMAYGSTRRIVLQGLDCAGLDVDEWYRQIEPGVVHHLDGESLYYTGAKGYKIEGWGDWRSTWSSRSFSSAADYMARHGFTDDEGPRVGLPAWTKEETSRILRSLDGAENEPDAEDEEDYGSTIIDDGWDPRFAEVFRKVTQGR